MDYKDTAEMIERIEVRVKEEEIRKTKEKREQERIFEANVQLDPIFDDKNDQKMRSFERYIAAILVHILFGAGLIYLSAETKRKWIFLVNGMIFWVLYVLWRDLFFLEDAILMLLNGFFLIISVIVHILHKTEQAEHLKRSKSHRKNGVCRTA
jgi:hypothetical protein